MLEIELNGRRRQKPNVGVPLLDLYVGHTHSNEEYLYHRDGKILGVKGVHLGNHGLRLKSFHSYLVRLAQAKQKPKLVRKERKLRNGAIVRFPQSSGVGGLFYYLDVVVQCYSAALRFSEHISAAYKILHEMGYMKDGDFGDKGRYSPTDPEISDMDAFDELLAALHSHYKSKFFENKLNKRIRKSDREIKSNLEFLDYLLVRHKKLLVIPFDLVLKKDDPRDAWDPFENKMSDDKLLVDLIVIYRTDFLNRLRHAKFSDCLKGYYWWVDFGELVGYRLHFLAFLSGGSMDGCKSFARRCGELWIDCTNQKGDFRIPDPEADHPALSYGYGKLTRDDSRQVEKISHALVFRAHLGDHFLPVHSGKRYPRYHHAEPPGMKAVIAARRRGKSPTFLEPEDPLPALNGIQVATGGYTAIEWIDLVKEKETQRQRDERVTRMLLERSRRKKANRKKKPGKSMMDNLRIPDYSRPPGDNVGVAPASDTSDLPHSTSTSKELAPIHRSTDSLGRARSKDFGRKSRLPSHKAGPGRAGVAKKPKTADESPDDLGGQDANSE
ncbi:MAG: hypothetical protein ACOY33_13945 [Pseudomonadota bacterium]